MANNLTFTTCPVCKNGYMQSVGERTGGFSAGKAALGAVVAGPIGLAAGALGKKKRPINVVNVAIPLKNKRCTNGYRKRIIRASE